MQERLQTNLPTKRVGDGNNLGDACLHPHSGRAVHYHGAHHTFNLRIMVSIFFTEVLNYIFYLVFCTV